MPRIVRPMRVEVDNLPKIGTQSKCLGVREPGNADIDLDDSGNVKLNGRGLSVVSDWRRLPGFLIPEHLENEFNGASGRGLRVFVHGAEGFNEGDVAELSTLIEVDDVFVLNCAETIRDVSAVIHHARRAFFA